MNKKLCSSGALLVLLMTQKIFALAAPNVTYQTAGKNFAAYKKLFESQVKGQAL